jgi:hypothetical protein
VSTHSSRRSYEPVTDDDLARLAAIGAEHHQRFCAAHSAWTEELLAVCLAQGGAAHRVSGTKGVKDLDVWLFYALPAGRNPAHFPWNRLILHVDFGPSHHGHQLYTDEERADPKLDVTVWERFEGRRVDLIARAIRPHVDGPHAAIWDWLEAGARGRPRSSSAWWLAQAAVVDLGRPARGHQVWP